MSTSIPEQPNTPQPTGSVKKPKPRTKTRATKARHKATRANQRAKARGFHILPARHGCNMDILE